jgi:hypothetical protein
VGSIFGPVRFLLPLCRLSWFLCPLNINNYQISAINSYWEKCDEKYLGRTEGQTDRGKTVYPLHPSGSGGIKMVSLKCKWRVQDLRHIHTHCVEEDQTLSCTVCNSHTIIKDTCSSSSWVLDSSFAFETHHFYTPAPRRVKGVYCFTSVRLSRQTGSRNLMGPKTLPMIWGTYMTLVTKYQISAINSYWEKCRKLIFGHKLHIGMPYCGKRYWTRQIPTSCLPTLLIFIHIEHTFCICPFLVKQKSDGSKNGSHDMGYLHEACDQISDFCHQ